MSQDKRLDLANVRRQFETGSLRREDLSKDPLDQFRIWYREAEATCTLHANNMILSSSADGWPTSRTLLLKGIDEHGLLFYTNYQSRKAHQIDRDPRVAVTLFWEALERQVNVRGLAERVTTEDSDQYFATRPRGSQLGAWASAQSEELADRQLLEVALEHYEELFAGRDVPRPPHWGGYRIRPQIMEFWQGRSDRLHDRFEYRLKDDHWQIVRLSP
jgi:pyridoxamine 5'-phosphate oxidase